MSYANIGKQTKQKPIARPWVSWMEHIFFYDSMSETEFIYADFSANTLWSTLSFSSPAGWNEMTVLSLWLVWLVSNFHVSKNGVQLASLNVIKRYLVNLLQTSHFMKLKNEHLKWISDTGILFHLKVTSVIKSDKSCATKHLWWNEGSPIADDSVVARF